MAVWDGLGQSYEALDAPELALRAYRAAAEAAPARGRLAARLAGKVKKLEAVVAARAAAGAPARAEQAPGGAAE